MKGRQITRRTVLKGFGAALALPVLEAMSPGLALAAETNAAPRRLGFVYVPNGIHMQEWTPKGDGANFQLGWVAEPLEPFKDSLTFLTGLTCDKARANGDGPGDHARAMSAYLTGCQPRKTGGADIKVGISADQLAAQHLGQETKLPSLEIGCDRGGNAGSCDSGYSCAYSNNLSWRSEATPSGKEVSPKQVFERLFGSTTRGEAQQSQALREHFRKSILDFVAEDAQRLQKQLGGNDRRKLDEYYTAVRELEVRITRASQSAQARAPGLKLPNGVPGNYEEHLRLLSDLTVLALQTDQTRVFTFVFANEGSNRSYSFIGVPEGHHDLSHHGNDRQKQEKIRQINRFHVTQFAYLLEKLRSVKEGNGTLLDNCLIAYGSGNSDGNRHNHDDLPVLVAGKAGGFRPGRHVRLPRETPLTNLWLAMLNHLDVPATQLGDSTGILAL